jgi:hypothetical protein
MAAPRDIQMEVDDGERRLEDTRTPVSISWLQMTCNGLPLTLDLQVVDQTRAM